MGIVCLCLKRGLGKQGGGNVFIHIFHPVSQEPESHMGVRDRDSERGSTLTKRGCKVEAGADWRQQRQAKSFFLPCFVEHIPALPSFTPSSLFIQLHQGSG